MALALRKPFDTCVIWIISAVCHPWRVVWRKLFSMHGSPPWCGAGELGQGGTQYNTRGPQSTQRLGHFSYGLKKLEIFL